MTKHELEPIKIADKSNLNEVRTRIHWMAKGLNFDVIDSAKIALYTTELLRYGYEDTFDDVVVTVGIGKTENGTGLHMRINLRNTLGDKLNDVSGIFDSVVEDPYNINGHEVRLFKLLPDAVFQVGDDFIDLQNKKWADFPKEKLIDVSIETSRELIRLYDEVKASRDALEKKYTEIVDNEEVKTEFLSKASHELRTPLAAMRESLNIVLDGLLGTINEKQEDILRNAKNNVDRLNRIVDGVLDLHKLQAGKMRMQMEHANINESVAFVVKTMQHLFTESNMSITTNLDPAITDTRFDRDKIVQVLTNLVNNAYKFTREGGVQITTTNNEKSILIVVKDTGPGIKEEDKNKLFKYFQQLDIKSDKHIKGTGLGLAICKEIVEAHKGKIWVESTLEQGSSFIVDLPKIDDETLLKDNINRWISVREAMTNEFCLFAIRFNECVYSVTNEVQEITRGDIRSFVSDIRKVIRDVDFVMESGKNEIYVISSGNKENAEYVKRRFVRVLKRSAIDQNKILTFSYGSSFYPEDSTKGLGLIKQAEINMVSEKEVRNGKFILVVDDDNVTLKIVKNMLSTLGYINVTEAHDGAEALDYVDQKTPDLVVLDMQMPKINGYEFIGRIKTDVKLRHLPIVAMSGYDIDINKLKEYGDENIIPSIKKPIDKDKLDKWLYYSL